MRERRRTNSSGSSGPKRCMIAPLRSATASSSTSATWKHSIRTCSAVPAVWQAFTPTSTGFSPSASTRREGVCRRISPTTGRGSRSSTSFGTASGRLWTTRLRWRKTSSSFARIWSFYILSGGGTANELFFGDLDLEFFQEFGVFGHFLAKQRDQIQAGGPVGFPPPLGQRFIGGSAFGAEGDQRGQ